MTDILNVNVGVLGHVDSGKTSLVRALSTELSTAALDKNPQSQERGITLDLGFSAFLTDIPEHLAGESALQPVTAHPLAPPHCHPHFSLQAKATASCSSRWWTAPATPA